MSGPFLSLAGRAANSATLLMPFSGRWVADVELDEAEQMSGTVELVLGTRSLLGVVRADRSGAWALRTSYRILGGAGAWGTVVPAKAYHNDAGIKRSLVAQDVARAIGETLVIDDSVDGRLGVDFVRMGGPARRVLAQLFPGVPWWVADAGETHVGPRATTPAEGIELLDFDARWNVATVSVNDPAALEVGAQITSPRLSAPFTIREYELVIATGAVRATCPGVLAA